MARIARRRAETGYTSNLELRQAEGEYRATEQLVPQAQLLVARQENALSLLLGSSPGPIPRGLPLDRLLAPRSIAVIGASDRQRRLDVGLLAQWVGQARVLGAERGAPLSLTLHRAFDLCPDLPTALEDAILLGFDRVLTSGGAPRAVDGAAMLERLHRQADGRITILAGSGVNRATLPVLLATGIGEIHASCRQTLAVPDDSPERRFGFIGPQIGGTDVETVAGLVRDLHANASLE